MAASSSRLEGFYGGGVVSESPERAGGNETLIYVGIAAVVLVVLLLAARK